MNIDDIIWIIMILSFTYFFVSVFALLVYILKRIIKKYKKYKHVMTVNKNVGRTNNESDYIIDMQNERNGDDAFREPKSLVSFKNSTYKKNNMFFGVDRFGIILANTYYEACKQVSNIFEGTEFYNSMEMSIKSEVTLLVYFAYDYAIISNTKNELNIRIRNEFHSQIGFGLSLPPMFIIRTNEYIKVFKEGGKENGVYNIGSHFAECIGQVNNKNIGIVVSNAFLVVYDNISQYIIDNLDNILLSNE